MLIHLEMKQPKLFEDSLKIKIELTSALVRMAKVAIDHIEKNIFLDMDV